jgi:hypothetical protein
MNKLRSFHILLIWWDGGKNVLRNRNNGINSLSEKRKRKE